MKLVYFLIANVQSDHLKRPYDMYPKTYHYQRFVEENKWISKMSQEEWAFFTKEQNNCGQLEDPVNGKLSCKLKRGSAYCRITCYQGYILQDQRTKAQWCQNRAWTPSIKPNCIPDPKYKGKLQNSGYARSRNVLGDLYLSELQELFGDDLTGVYDEKATCKKINHPSNGVFWCDDDENDKSSCTFMCQDGFHPIGPLKKKCQCRNGECGWNPDEKSYCKKNPTCDRIEVPENGRIECPVDSLCVVSCDDGFEMENGIMERTLHCHCDFNSYECLWDHPKPVCKPRNGCLDSNCASNAACRHGPNGWGCTCDCGYQGDGKSCSLIEPTEDCDLSTEAQCACRKGWNRARDTSDICRAVDMSNIEPCKFHGLPNFKDQISSKEFKELETIVDCSGNYDFNISSVTIPGNAETFVMQNTFVQSTQGVKETLANLLKLTVTNLGGNALTFFDHTMFENNCKLTSVNLAHGLVPPVISASLFYNNPKLKIADFSSLNSRIPSQLFLTTNALEWISLRGNEIPVLTTLIAKHKRRLRFLDISNCEIRAVLDSAFLDAKRLEVLKMRHNRIRHLTAGQLKGLYSLYKIDLFDNLIETLGGDMFIDSPLLKYIDLSSNTKLKHICRSTFIRHEYLEEVNLRNNISLHPSLQKKFCLSGGGNCEGSLLSMQRLLLTHGANC